MLGVCTCNEQERLLKVLGYFLNLPFWHCQAEIQVWAQAVWQWCICGVFLWWLVKFIIQNQWSGMAAVCSYWVRLSKWAVPPRQAVKWRPSWLEFCVTLKARARFRPLAFTSFLCVTWVDAERDTHIFNNPTRICLSNSYFQLYSYKLLQLVCTRQK